MPSLPCATTVDSDRRVIVSSLHDTKPYPSSPWHRIILSHKGGAGLPNYFADSLEEWVSSPVNFAGF
jgi:hypothetical protein